MCSSDRSGWADALAASGAALEPLTTEQTAMMNTLLGAARHVLEKGDHLPVAAFVMRPAGKIEYIDLGRGFAHQNDALTATLQRLIPMARANEIKASGIMFQAEGAGQAKSQQILLDIEQVGQLRLFISMNFKRSPSVEFDGLQFTKTPAKLLAQPQ
jgi:hypothetical protein